MAKRRAKRKEELFRERISRKNKIISMYSRENTGKEDKKERTS